MRKLPAWFRSHPIVSILLALAALFAGTHFFLNWQSERRWQAYVKEGRARGVKFDLAEFAPPKIPDEENFAALPMMRAIMQPGAKSPTALPDKDRPSFGNPLKGERLDWKKWQTFFKDAGFISETTDSAPRDVLRALEHYAPQFQEWSEWKTRHRCRFDLDRRPWLLRAAGRHRPRRQGAPEPPRHDRSDRFGHVISLNAEQAKGRPMGGPFVWIKFPGDAPPP